MNTLMKQESRNWAVIENRGEKIFGVLHQPMVDNPPIVVVLHGFASNKMGTGGSYLKLAARLIQADLACFRFDFRGFGDSEGDPSEMDIEEFISDIHAVVAFLEKAGYTRMGIFGSSFGASLGILAASERNNFKALALWAPVATGEIWYRDFISRKPEYTATSPGEALSSYQGIKLKEGFKEQFSKMRADEALKLLRDVPLIHFQGESDQVLSLEHQRAFQNERKGATAPTHFITYPDTDHWLGYTKVLPQVIEHSANWFKTYL